MKRKESPRLQAGEYVNRCSKTSSNCGNKKDMRLGVRTYYCPGCGRYIDRNCWNASVNILNS
ncbi:zinc ribbon domain-containing protein [Microcoleus sp. D2_18a_B4]|uniref:zinc ribbon domain-containing protein n=1 Tax=Microcoleus sp. D2_18a_B4 TaxID=3055329 RepID=UPI002FD2A714